MRRTLALALALLSAWMALPTSVLALDREAWFTSAGAGWTPICSEPLGATDSPVDSNPNDSSTSPCNGGNALEAPSWSPLSFGTANGLPSSASITRSLKLTGNVGTTHVLPSGPSGLTNGSYIFRHFTRWSSDADCPDLNGRRKVIEHWPLDTDTGTQHGQIQIEIGPNSCSIHYKFDYVRGTCNLNDSKVATSGDTITMTDCKGGWCEFQLNVAGDFANNTGIYWYGRVTLLASDGSVAKQQTFTTAAHACSPAGPLNFGIGARDMWIANAFNGQTAQDSTGSREIVLALVAQSTTQGALVPLPVELTGSPGTPGQPAFMPWRVAP